MLERSRLRLLLTKLVLVLVLPLFTSRGLTRLAGFALIAVGVR